MATTVSYYFGSFFHYFFPAVFWYSATTDLRRHAADIRQGIPAFIGSAVFLSRPEQRRPRRLPGLGCSLLSTSAVSPPFFFFFFSFFFFFLPSLCGTLRLLHLSSEPYGGNRRDIKSVFGICIRDFGLAARNHGHGASCSFPTRRRYKELHGVGRTNGQSARETRRWRVCLNRSQVRRQLIGIGAPRSGLRGVLSRGDGLALACIPLLVMVGDDTHDDPKQAGFSVAAGIFVAGEGEKQKRRCGGAW